MKRTVKTDPFFDKQPKMTFIEELSSPFHKEAPSYYGKRDREGGEIDARGIYIAERYADDPDGLLETVYADLAKFFKVYGIGGERYPIRIVKGETECFEAYSVVIAEEGITVTASDTEGVRRALIYIEDELRISEAAYLKPTKVTRVPHLRSRITRCYFSPINRPPKFGDELSDDIDYYPDEYLNRLMHDGSNGVWIYTRFSDLMTSDYIKENGKGGEARIAKLNRVIEKCRRYGIGVYVFAIEPHAFSEDEAKKYPEMCGVDSGRGITFCANSDMGKAYLKEQGEKLVTLCPRLKGFMSITFGERFTSCSSAKNYRECPRCGGKGHGEVLSAAVEGLCSGMRKNPDFEVISWTYGARERIQFSSDWRADIAEYVKCAPSDAMLMQNFDDMGYEEQLGVMRQGVDYWLSYVGPSELFVHTANEAKKHGKHMFAKMQVCCSHEIASVPYVPTPGIIYKKMKAAHELSVEGLLQCWYFGNYPSLMSKTAGELAFDGFDDEEKALTRIAAIYFGRTKATSVVESWRLFEEAYRNYPLNVMFSYYGPMHDSVVWKLALKPKNFPLARTWQSLDPVDGDRICDALLDGHTLDEALKLCRRMSELWSKGLEKLAAVTVDGADEAEQHSVARAIGILFNGGVNILEFYKLREELGLKVGDARAKLERMRELTELEIQNSLAMIPLSNSDNRLGYHSEAEGHKFFEAKLLDRVQWLRELLETEFPEVEQRIADGLSPLEFYDGIEDNDEVARYDLRSSGLESADWANIEDIAKFRMTYDDNSIVIELVGGNDVEYALTAEFVPMRRGVVAEISPLGTVRLGRDALMYNSLFGERGAEELKKWSNIKVSCGDETRMILTLDRKDFGLTELRPFRMRINGSRVDYREFDPAGKMPPESVVKMWGRDPAPLYLLGCNRCTPTQFGWIIPRK